jgi:hypothetical protein
MKIYFKLHLGTFSKLFDTFSEEYLLLPHVAQFGKIFTQWQKHQTWKRTWFNSLASFLFFSNVH